MFHKCNSRSLVGLPTDTEISFDRFRNLESTDSGNKIVQHFQDRSLWCVSLSYHLGMHILKTNVLRCAVFHAWKNTSKSSQKSRIYGAYPYVSYTQIMTIGNDFQKFSCMKQNLRRFPIWNVQSLFPIDHLYRPQATRSSANFPQDLTKLANSLDLRMEALLREHEQAGTLVGWWVLWAGGQGWLSEMKGFWETKMETQPLIWNTW